MVGDLVDLSCLSLQEIKELLETRGPDRTVLDALARDPRQSARVLYRQWARRLAREVKEAGRVEELFRYEFQLVREGYETVAGVDEAGRGPLAGPVVAAAVVLPVPCVIMNLKDSKRLTPAQRAQAADEIRRLAVAWGIGLASVEEINEFNILQASLLAMRRALAAMDVRPDWVLVDGNQKIPGVGVPQRALVKGDNTSASVAAASILAKVFRDELMSACHWQYPLYDFPSHKGYATRAHYEALRRHGPCRLHRSAFLPAPRLFEGDGEA